MAKRKRKSKRNNTVSLELKSQDERDFFGRDEPSLLTETSGIIEVATPLATEFDDEPVTEVDLPTIEFLRREGTIARQPTPVPLPDHYDLDDDGPTIIFDIPAGIIEAAA